MPTLSSRLDHLAAAAARTDAPGFALSVLRDGDVLLARGYGLADLAHATPITSKTVFHLASTSKQFIACGIALLAAQGVLTLDDDIRTYLPEMPSYGAPITIRHLIHHQSGLRECLTLWTLIGRDHTTCGPPEAVLELVARQRQLHFPSGAAYEYCNTNYLLLALIIERSSGQPLATFASQQLFQPLGMTSSGVYDDRSVIAQPQAWGYLSTPEGYRLAPAGIGVLGAAGVFSSIDDLARWEQNVAQPVVGDPQLIADLQTPARLADGTPTHYAFGLFVQTYRGQPVISHAGAFPGIGTQLLRFPAQRLAVICLCNQERLNPSVLAFQIADMVLDTMAMPSRGVHVGVTIPHATDLSQYTGTFRTLRSRQLAQVVIADGQLILQLPEGNLPLVAVGDHGFVVAAGFDEARVTFSLDAGGAPQRMALAVEGEEESVFEPVVPIGAIGAGVDLAAYAGAYWCDELGIAYTFACDSDRLILRGPDLLLEPTVRDSFSGSYGMVFEFERDDQGVVTALWCSAQHAYRLAFTRLPAVDTSAQGQPVGGTRQTRMEAS